MAEITGGTLYEINRDLMKREPVLSVSDIKVKKKLIDDFFEYTYLKAKYFMLLCRERYDFTIFNFKDQKFTTDVQTATNILIDECLANRGNIKGIDKINDNSAIEIWLEIDEEIYCYYLFPCDDMIVEIGGSN